MSKASKCNLIDGQIHLRCMSLFLQHLAKNMFSGQPDFLPANCLSAEEPSFQQVCEEGKRFEKTDLIQLHYWFEHNTESGNAGERLLSAKSIDDEDWPKKVKLR